MIDSAVFFLFLFPYITNTLKMDRGEGVDLVHLREKWVDFE